MQENISKCFFSEYTVWLSAVYSGMAYNDLLVENLRFLRRFHSAQSRFKGASLKPRYQSSYQKLESLGYDKIKTF